MKKWIKQHPTGAILILAAILMLIGATVFLLIWFKEYIFTQNTLAIVIFSVLGLLIVGVFAVSTGLLSRKS